MIPSAAQALLISRKSKFYLELVNVEAEIWETMSRGKLILLYTGKNIGNPRGSGIIDLSGLTPLQLDFYNCLRDVGYEVTASDNKWKIKWSELDAAIAPMKGPPGVPGEMGLPGEDGLQGADGLQGEQGIKGDTGAQGLTGDPSEFVQEGIQYGPSLVLVNEEDEAWLFATPERIDHADINTIRENATLGVSSADSIQATPSQSITVVNQDGEGIAVIGPYGIELAGVDLVEEAKVNQTDQQPLDLARLQVVQVTGESVAAGAFNDAITMEEVSGAYMFNGGIRWQDTSLDPAVACDSLVPLKSESFTISGTRHGETALPGFILGLQQLLLQENGIDLTQSGIDILGFSTAIAGKTDTQLLTETTPVDLYKMVEDSWEYAATRADERGDSLGGPILLHTTGHNRMNSGNDPVVFRSELEDYHDAIIATVLSKTGIVTEAPMFSPVTGSWNDAGVGIQIPMKQLEIAAAHDWYNLTMPGYLLGYIPAGVHFLAEATKLVGLAAAVSYKRRYIDGLAWGLPEPDTFERDGKWLIVTYKNVPGGRLGFYTDWVSNPGNYGISLFESDGVTEATYEKVPFLYGTAGNQIAIKTDTTVGSDWIYSYAARGTGSGRVNGPRGCLAARPFVKFQGLPTITFRAYAATYERIIVP